MLIYISHRRRKTSNIIKRHRYICADCVIFYAHAGHAQHYLEQGYYSYLSVSLSRFLSRAKTGATLATGQQACQLPYASRLATSHRPAGLPLAIGQQAVCMGKTIAMATVTHWQVSESIPVKGRASPLHKCCCRGIK